MKEVDEQEGRGPICVSERSHQVDSGHGSMTVSLDRADTLMGTVPQVGKGADVTGFDDTEHGAHPFQHG